MGKVISLGLEGDFSKGFWVTLDWEMVGQPSTKGSARGRLEPAPKIPELYREWSDRYRCIEEIYRLQAEPLESNTSEECRNLAERLKEAINTWINSNSPTFYLVRDSLVKELNQDPNTRVLIRTDDVQARQIPWILWNFWEQHCSVDISLSIGDFTSTPTIRRLRNSVRILAVLGSNEGINVQIDKEALKQLPSVDPSSEILEEPSREELYTELRNAKGWDILFFAGHSSSTSDGTTGHISINRTESLTIDDLKYALQEALRHGLKLAIFNSCDGLGLAHQLASLQMPHVIVMREPVPDIVAHIFLKHFLKEFSKGSSLQRAMKSARERLEPLQRQLPYATWMPVLYQHPTAQHLIWPRQRVHSVSPLIWIGSTLLTIILAGAAVGWALRDRDLRIERVRTLNSESKNLSVSNQSIEALIASLKAGQQLQRIIVPPNDLKAATVDTLEQVVNTTQVIDTTQPFNRLDGHEGEVYSVEFSPNGQTIATASEDETVKLWSQQGKELNILEGHQNRVWSVKFSPNSQTIATTSWDGTIKLWSWDGKKRRELDTLPGHQGWVFGVSFSRDGRTIVSVGADKIVRLWSWDGKQGQLQKHWPSGHTNSIVDVAFSPDDKIIVTASDDGTAKLWNWNGTLHRTLEDHRDEVNGVSFSPDGQWIATASDDNTAKLWNYDGTLHRTLKGHSEEVISVSFSPNSQIIATASFDKTVKLWNLNGTQRETLQGHNAYVWDANFSPDGQIIASASRSGTVKLWHLDHTKLQQPSNLSDLMVSGCDLLRDYLKNNRNVQQSDRRICDGP